MPTTTTASTDAAFYERVQRVLNGDRAEGEALFAEIRSFTIAYYRTSSHCTINHEHVGQSLAEDLAGEFVNDVLQYRMLRHYDPAKCGWKAFLGFRARRNFWGYIHRLGEGGRTSAATTKIERNVGSGFSVLDPGDPPEHRLSREQLRAGGLKELMYQERCQRYRPYLAKLDLLHRYLLEQRYCYGQKVTELAKRIGMTARKAQVAQRRAERLLLDMIRATEGEG